MLENVQIVFHKQPKFKTPAAQCTQKNRKKTRKQPLLLALRRWGRFARNVLSGEERGETTVFAG